MQLFGRISENNYVEDIYLKEDSTVISKMLHANGVDLKDCSSDRDTADIQIPDEKGFKLPISLVIK